MQKHPYTEQDALRDALERANREQATIHVYRDSSEVPIWYVRTAEAAPPKDAELFARVRPDNATWAGYPLTWGDES